MFLKDFPDSPREKEWQEIENLVLSYQELLSNNTDPKKLEEISTELINRFKPLFNKYMKVIKLEDIVLTDASVKTFVYTFIDKSILKNKQITSKEVAYRFRFVTSTYGNLTEEEILSDFYEIFFRIAQRYKQVGRHFCGYIYNVFHYELSRYIKNYISDPLSVTYKCVSTSLFEQNTITLDAIIDDYYDKKEVLGIDWINGQNASKLFKTLSNIDRKILLLYYVECYSEREIAKNLGIHMNTINLHRRKAIFTLQANASTQELIPKRRRHLKRQ